MAFGFENELRAENDRLRNQLEAAVGKAAWHYENLTLLEEKMVERNAEIERLRLTDAEREAVERAAQWMVQLAKDRGEIHSAGYFVDDAATLRGLLERLGGE